MLLTERRIDAVAVHTLPQFALAEKVAFLSDAANHTDGSTRIEVQETHFSWLFLTRRFVYKLKKPLRQSSMDYRTLAARQRGCSTEVRLNRRLARRIYLAVVPLSTDRAGKLRLGPGHRVEDWLVKMVRLPAERMLDRALMSHTAGDAELAAIVARLAAFFTRAGRTPMEGSAYVERLRRQVTANRSDLLGASPCIQPSLVEAVSSRQLEFIAMAQGPLGYRGERVVEGHGDLRPEHVCIGPPVCVIDCLEFDRDLRLFDPLEEIAFLALEIERLGQGSAAADLLARFQESTGDTADEAIIRFYMSHRAATRAKLAAWHLRDPQFPVAQPWIERTHGYLQDAGRHCEEALRIAASRASAGRREEIGN